MKTSTTSTSLTTLPITSYLAYCRQNKRLDPKTIKAYRIDLTQFAVATTDTNINNINPDIIKSYIATLHNTFNNNQDKLPYPRRRRQGQVAVCSF